MFPKLSKFTRKVSLKYEKEAKGIRKNEQGTHDLGGSKYRLVLLTQQDPYSGALALKLVYI